MDKLYRYEFSFYTEVWHEDIRPILHEFNITKLTPTL